MEKTKEEDLGQTKITKIIVRTPIQRNTYELLIAI